MNDEMRKIPDEAGREMDYLIYKEVFNKPPIIHCRGCGENVVITQNNCTNCGVSAGWPDYSTDIAAAWEVVEKMKKTHLICIQFYGTKWPTWEAGFAKKISGGGNELWVSKEDNTAPLAICKAALMAVYHER